MIRSFFAPLRLACLVLAAASLSSCAIVIGGAVVDLNVMTRHRAFAAKAAKHTLTGARTFKAATTTIVLALSPFAIGSHSLNARDAAQMETGEEISFPAGSHFYWIEIFPQNL